MDRFQNDKSLALEMLRQENFSRASGFRFPGGNFYHAAEVLFKDNEPILYCNDFFRRFKN